MIIIPEDKVQWVVSEVDRILFTGDRKYRVKVNSPGSRNRIYFCKFLSSTVPNSEIGALTLVRETDESENCVGISLRFFPAHEPKMPRKPLMWIATQKGDDTTPTPCFCKINQTNASDLSLIEGLVDMIGRERMEEIIRTFNAAIPENIKYDGDVNEDSSFKYLQINIDLALKKWSGRRPDGSFLMTVCSVVDTAISDNVIIWGIGLPMKYKIILCRSTLGVTFYKYNDDDWSNGLPIKMLEEDIKHHFGYVLVDDIKNAIEAANHDKIRILGNENTLLQKTTKELNEELTKLKEDIAAKDSLIDTLKKQLESTVVSSEEQTESNPDKDSVDKPFIGAKIFFDDKAPKKWVELYTLLHDHFASWCRRNNATLQQTAFAHSNKNRYPSGINFYVQKRNSSGEKDKLKFSVLYDELSEQVTMRFFAENIQCLFINTPKEQFRIRQVSYCEPIISIFMFDEPKDGVKSFDITNGDPNNEMENDWRPLDVLKAYFGDKFWNDIIDIFGKFIPKQIETFEPKIDVKQWETDEEYKYFNYIRGQFNQYIHKLCGGFQVRQIANSIDEVMWDCTYVKGSRNLENVHAHIYLRHCKDQRDLNGIADDLMTFYRITDDGKEEKVIVMELDDELGSHIRLKVEEIYDQVRRMIEEDVERKPNISVPFPVVACIMDNILSTREGYRRGSYSKSLYECKIKIDGKEYEIGAIKDKYKIIHVFVSSKEAIVFDVINHTYGRDPYVWENSPWTINRILYNSSYHPKKLMSILEMIRVTIDDVCTKLTCKDSADTYFSAYYEDDVKPKIDNLSCDIIKKSERVFQERIGEIYDKACLGLQPTQSVLTVTEGECHKQRPTPKADFMFKGHVVNPFKHPYAGAFVVDEDMILSSDEIKKILQEEKEMDTPEKRTSLFEEACDRLSKIVRWWGVYGEITETHPSSSRFIITWKGKAAIRERLVFSLKCIRDMRIQLDIHDAVKQKRLSDEGIRDMFGEPFADAIMKFKEETNMSVKRTTEEPKFQQYSTDKNGKKLVTIPWDVYRTMTNTQYGMSVTFVKDRSTAIKEAYWNPKTCTATILWSDGTKTMAKPMKGTTADPEIGFALAIAKKFFKTQNQWRKWLSKVVKTGEAAVSKKKDKRLSKLTKQARARLAASGITDPSQDQVTSMIDRIESENMSAAKAAPKKRSTKKKSASYTVNE